MDVELARSGGGRGFGLRCIVNIGIENPGQMSSKVSSTGGAGITKRAGVSRKAPVISSPPADIP
jgi:hypothetical protein